MLVASYDFSDVVNSINFNYTNNMTIIFVKKK